MFKYLISTAFALAMLLPFSGAVAMPNADWPNNDGIYKNTKELSAGEVAILQASINSDKMPRLNTEGVKPFGYGLNGLKSQDAQGVASMALGSEEKSI